MPTTAATTSPPNRTIEQRYTQIRKLLRHQTQKFQRQHGGDAEELLAEANLAFVKAHRRHIPSPELPYHAKIRCAVWSHLLDKARTKARQNALARIHNAGASITNFADTKHFDRTQFQNKLGLDAQTVVKKILDNPTKLMALADAKGGLPRNIRSTLRNCLRAQQWSVDRINKAFEEIRKAL